MVVAFSRQSCFLSSQASGEAGFHQQIITDEKFSLQQQVPVCVTKLQRIRKKWKFMCHGLQPGYRPLQGWHKPSPKPSACWKSLICLHARYGGTLATAAFLPAAYSAGPPHLAFFRQTVWDMKKDAERMPAALSIKIPRQWGGEMRNF
ncbi:MAG: hypothetical protein ACLVEL_06920 [Ruthenibacterium sp.]|jgi:hypothetical protein